MTLGFDAKRVFQNHTGLGEYGRFVVRTLAARFPEVRSLLYAPRVDPELARELPTEVAASRRRPGVGFRSGPAATVWRTFRLGRTAARDGVTVFHGLSQELPRDLPRSVPAVVSILDLLPNRFPELFPPIDRHVYRWKLRWCTERADTIIVPSRKTASDLTEFYGVESSRIRTIPMSVNQRYRQRLSEDRLVRTRETYGLPADYVLLVGRLERRKNAIIGLQALERMAQADRPVLVLVGRRTRYATHLDAYIEEHRLQPWVRRIPWLPATELAAVYQSAAALFYPSRFEGFGIPVLEAMVSGIPVIAATGSSLEEVGGDAPFYIDPEDPDEVAAALGEVLSDTALAAGMVTRGYRRAAAFEDGPLAEALMAVYRELGAESP